MLIKHRMNVQVQGSGRQEKRTRIGNTFGFGARRGGGAETLPWNPAQQLSVLVIFIYSSIKTASKILSLFKYSSKADI
jgi:hypothetical protein